MRQLKFLLLCFCSLVFLVSYGQKKVTKPKDDTQKLPGAVMPLQEDFVHLSGEVKVIDSQYVLILTLSISGKHEISIDKARYYDHGEYSIASNRVFLSKWVRHTSVHIYTSEFKHPIFTEDWDKKITVTGQTPIADTVILTDIYPFETGEYFILAEIDYWNKSVKHTAQSTEIPFSVFFIPKMAPFD